MPSTTRPKYTTLPQAAVANEKMNDRQAEFNHAPLRFAEGLKPLPYTCVTRLEA